MRSHSVVVSDGGSDVSTEIGLPEEEDDLITSVFSYYAMLGNPLNRTQLGTAKVRLGGS